MMLSADNGEEVLQAMLRLLLALAFVGFLAGCDDFLTDAATRLAYQIEREAKALRDSHETTRTFTHTPKNSPEGVTGAYVVTFVAGPLGKGYLAFSKGSQEQWYHTSYHLRFVHVTENLKISKAEGGSFMVVLKRVGDGIHITELR
jgi:hypothetical protein